MKGKTKIIIIIVLVVVVIGIVYYYMSQSSTSTTASTSGAVSNPSPTDQANITFLKGWIAQTGANQSYWNSVLSSASSSTLAEWVACIQVFNTPGASLTSSQSAFWNQLANGH